jgi:DNA-damage-inducible protein D
MAEKRQRNLVPETRIAVFRGREVRKTIHQDEWWFVVEDVIAVLTDSADIKQYINRMRQRDSELSKGWVQFVHTLAQASPGIPS